MTMAIAGLLDIGFPLLGSFVLLCDDYMISHGISASSVPGPWRVGVLVLVQFMLVATKAYVNPRLISDQPDTSQTLA